MSRSHHSATFALVVLGTMLATAASAADSNLCAQTARAVLHACENEVRDDLWIAIGQCANLSDPEARKTCRRDAKQSRRDGTPECADQHDARDALCEALGENGYDPVIDPAHFLSPEETAADPNPFYPLVPGVVQHYVAGDETGTVTVTGDTKDILGVECTVVHDLVEVNGKPIEDTLDYFAQDVDGNVWYFGELSQSFENGELTSLEGSFTAGVDGAKPGIIMKASPTVGETYRQEWALGEAEDAATVESVTASATVPGASCNGTCLQTLDFTPLEPDVQEQKFYAPGIGTILEVDLETGERTELVSVTGP